MDKALRTGAWVTRSCAESRRTWLLLVTHGPAAMGRKSIAAAHKPAALLKSTKVDVDDDRDAYVTRVLFVRDRAESARGLSVVRKWIVDSLTQRRLGRS